MDPRIAHAFVAAGIEILEEIAYVPIDELLSIDALTESEVRYFRQRARGYLLQDELDSKGSDGAIDV